jgi:hypothetical protein
VYNSAYLLETFAQVGGNTAYVSPQPKRNLFIFGATKHEANGSRDAVRVRHDLRNVDLHIMSGVGVGQDARTFHDRRDMKILEERILQ